MLQPEQTIGGRAVHFRRFTYDDSAVVAVDFGASASDIEPAVDIVGETAIVVVDSADGSDQFEFDLPGPDAKVFMKNGVLSIEVEV